ncbi:hypothetical protein SprV_0602207900 [Sparganum proliferum]
MAKSGSKSQKKHAAALLPLIRNTHFLLVSLLLTNAACVESMPIFLDRVLSPTLAVAISVTSVLVVGEVIPQALFKRHNLKLSYYMLPFTYITLILTAPISYPVSRILNLVLKKEGPTLFTRSEIKLLIKMHGPVPSLEVSDSSGGEISSPLSLSCTPPSSLLLPTESDTNISDAPLVGSIHNDAKFSSLQSYGCSPVIEKSGTLTTQSELSEDEVRMISSILSLRDGTTNDILLPIDKAFILHTTDLMGKEFFSRITDCGIPYVPVCIGDDRSRLRGVINVQKLLACNILASENNLGDLIGKEKPPWFQPLPYVSDRMNLLTLLGVLRDTPYDRVVAVTSEIAFDSTSIIKCQLVGFGEPGKSHLTFSFEQRHQMQDPFKYGSNQTTQQDDFVSSGNAQLIRATGIVTWRSLMDHLFKA